jgi:hypothetical protein
MLKAIVLICAIGTQPYDCGEDGARDIIRTPVEYPRVVCVRPALPGNVG